MSVFTAAWVGSTGEKIDMKSWMRWIICHHCKKLLYFSAHLWNKPVLENE